MSDFVQGLGFGLILQISVGPACITVLQKGIEQGFYHAFAMAWGAALVDTLYISLSMVGVSALLRFEPARAVIGLEGLCPLLREADKDLERGLVLDPEPGKGGPLLLGQLGVQRANGILQCQPARGFLQIDTILGGVGLGILGRRSALGGGASTARLDGRRAGYTLWGWG